MSTWNDCQKVYSFGKFLSHEKDENLHRYLKVFGKDCNVWWDPKGRCFTSTNEIKNVGLKKYEYSFLYKPQDFLTSRKKAGSCGGKHYVDEKLAPIWGREMIATTEYLHQDIAFFKKFEGSKILLVGAGPSAIDVKWEEHDYDYIWSCNKFYKNPRLKNKEVALYFAGSEVELLKNPELERYMKSFPNSHLCIQPADSRTPGEMRGIKKKYPSQSTYVHLRYRSRLGQLPRLLLLALHLKAKEIAFVGMDGLPNKKTPHAFEPGKVPKEEVTTMSGAGDLFRRQYTVFWDYVLNTLNPSTKMVNLGENTKGNLSSSISRKMFPLTTKKKTGEEMKYYLEANGKKNNYS